MKRVIVSQTAVQRMRIEMKAAPNTETGGVLIGHLQGDDLVVVDASGPGPRAELLPYSVLIDGQYAGAFCAQALKESSGKYGYVGDWHCHLACTYSASPQDHIAMGTMADYADAGTKTPISLIWAKYRNAFVTYLFTEHRHLKRIPKRVVNLRGSTADAS